MRHLERRRSRRITGMDQTRSREGAGDGMTVAFTHRVGAVVIGRNEGERLIRCLCSLVGRVEHVVYVDSGSTDDSVQAAKSLGVSTVTLDLSQPFTAARARNRGVAELRSMGVQPDFVQFVDGDCEVDENWIGRGVAALEADPRVAVVCGRRRERFPEASKYNRLCDLEWDTPPGEVRSCGGDAMMRLRAFDEVGGYDSTLIAGEEPELCVRLRRAGWRILRLDAEMTLHDAAMTRFGQWWRRSVRAGHAYAEGAWMHGRSPQRHNVREVRSILTWALFIPAATAALVWPAGGWGLLLLSLYPLQWWRIFVGQRRRGRTASQSRLYATFTMLGKFAQLRGMVGFAWNRLRGRRMRLIEYKGAAVRSATASTNLPAARPHEVTGS